MISQGCTDIQTTLLLSYLAVIEDILTGDGVLPPTTVELFVC